MNFKALRFWRAIGGIVVFLLVGTGQLVHARISGGTDIAASSLPLILWSLYYGLFSGFAVIFIVDLMFAFGHLRSRARLCHVIIAMLLLTAFLSTLDIVDSFVLAVVAFAIGVLVVAYGTISIWRNRNHTFDLNSGAPGVMKLPAKYLRRRPIVTALETVFRLFPYPEPIGLYRVGEPGLESPVIVTGNYELTVRRVARGTIGMDIWLLVCDSRGINIWCSSLAGHFGVAPIIHAIEYFGLSTIVSHRRLILPQLCAGGVSVSDITAKTGFGCRFGPVDISRLVSAKSDSISVDARHVKFPLRDRVEMAFGTPIFVAILFCLVFNFFDPGQLVILLPMLYVISIIQASIFPFRPIRNVPVWSVIFGAAVFVGLWLVLRLTSFTLLTNGGIIALGIGAAYLVNEFEGWSPLVKYSMFTRRKVPIITIADACVACGRCVDVCPKGVYRVSDKRAVVVEPNACISCQSCVMQCHSDAITFVSG